MGETTHILTCAACGTALKIDRRLLDTTFRCPKCGQPNRYRSPAHQDAERQQAQAARTDRRVILGGLAACVIVLGAVGAAVWRFGGDGSAAVDPSDEGSAAVPTENGDVPVSLISPPPPPPRVAAAALRILKAAGHEPAKANWTSDRSSYILGFVTTYLTFPVRADGEVDSLMILHGVTGGVLGDTADQRRWDLIHDSYAVLGMFLGSNEKRCTDWLIDLLYRAIVDLSLLEKGVSYGESHVFGDVRVRCSFSIGEYLGAIEVIAVGRLDSEIWNRGFRELRRLPEGAIPVGRVERVWIPGNFYVSQVRFRQSYDTLEAIGEIENPSNTAYELVYLRISLYQDGRLVDTAPIQILSLFARQRKTWETMFFNVKLGGFDTYRVQLESTMEKEFP